MSAPNDASHRARLLLFLVDDEPMVLELAELILANNYDLRKFRDPKLALEQFPSQKPDLIITDYAMNGMHGLALMDACRKIRPGQKVLLMSGTVGAEICDHRDAKPDAFIAKPFEIAEFAAAVRSLVAA